MKKKLFEALKAKFEGVSDDILNRIADKLAKTVTKEEDVATSIEGVTIQQVLESYGDSRATEAQQTAVTNYEKKHGLRDGKKIEESNQEEPPVEKSVEEKMPKWAKDLMDEFKTMKENKAASNRKSTLDAILKNAPEKYRLRYEKDFERMSFKDDEDFNTWIEDIKPDMEAVINEFNTKGGVFRRPMTGTHKGEDGNNPLLEERIKERSAETTATAIQGLSK